MAGAAGGEFVEGWLVAQVLGEGAYGEVRLLVHARSGAAVALKAVRGAGAGGSGAGGSGAGGAAREAALHRALRHRHVLRCLGERTHQGLHYMFLEYARGGELFDRIEPDAGTGEAAARRYWRQLLAGLQYLHSRGVAHRDIKPENLLLDHHDEIKISDFGMATLFRHGARERLLARVCGTLPYAAPEVLAAAARPYRAPPADLWAAALVLLAMLAGELPWERANDADARYAAWSAWAAGGAAGGGAAGGGAAGGGAAAGGAAVGGGPWRKAGGALALLRRALHPDAARRPSLAALAASRWLTEPGSAGGAPAEDEGRAWRSQPAGAAAEPPADLSPAAMDALLSHSQPAHAADLVLAECGPLLARRRTRLLLPAAEPEAWRALLAALVACGFAGRRLSPRLVGVECGGGVHLRAWLVVVGGGCVLEVRRWRGCGLQFKRRFVELRAELRLRAGASDPPDLLEQSAAHFA